MLPFSFCYFVHRLRLQIALRKIILRKSKKTLKFTVFFACQCKRKTFFGICFTFSIRRDYFLWLSNILFCMNEHSMSARKLSHRSNYCLEYFPFVKNSWMETFGVPFGKRKRKKKLFQTEIKLNLSFFFVCVLLPSLLRFLPTNWLHRICLNENEIIIPFIFSRIRINFVKLKC